MKLFKVSIAIVFVLASALSTVGCQQRYRCVGHQDQLIENRRGESGPPLCETPDGRFYNAVQD